MHKPVLLQEVIDIFHPVPGQRFVDATANGGGHTFALWEKVKPDGAILALDKDSSLIDHLDRRAKAEGARITAVSASYVRLPDIIRDHGFGPVSGILFDLGYSSWHIEGSGRGFSFDRDEPLVMRYEASAHDGVTAYETVNRFPEAELKEIFSTFGEERFSGRIARAICTARTKTPIRTSRQLADIVKGAYPRERRHGRIHPATRTFQALRIFVNRELDELKQALPAAIDILESGGKILVISFHSLEDRIVKDCFRTGAARGELEVITKKPLQPAAAESAENPRARSAKLRAAIKI